MVGTIAHEVVFDLFARNQACNLRADWGFVAWGEMRSCAETMRFTAAVRQDREGTLNRTEWNRKGRRYCARLQNSQRRTNAEPGVLYIQSAQLYGPVRTLHGYFPLPEVTKFCFSKCSTASAVKHYWTACGGFGATALLIHTVCSMVGALQCLGCRPQSLCHAFKADLLHALSLELFICVDPRPAHEQVNMPVVTNKGLHFSLRHVPCQEQGSAFTL